MEQARQRAVGDSCGAWFFVGLLPGLNGHCGSWTILGLVKGHHLLSALWSLDVGCATFHTGQLSFVFCIRSPCRRSFLDTCFSHSFPGFAGRLRIFCPRLWRSVFRAFSPDLGSSRLQNSLCEFLRSRAPSVLL